MLATMVEHVIGIDPDRDRVTASVVDTATTGEQATAVFATTRRGYDQLLVWANQHTPARRAWAVEGTGSYGARRDQLSHFPRRTGGGVQQPPPDPRRRQNRRSGRPPRRPPGARPFLAIRTAGQGRPRSSPRVGNHPTERPNRPDNSYQRAQSAGHNRAHRPQRPTPGSEHHRVGHQNQQVPVRVAALETNWLLPNKPCVL